MNSRNIRLNRKLQKFTIIMLVALFIIQGMLDHIVARAETKNGISQLQQVKENVFRFETNCIDERGNRYPISTGTCFLIGDISRGQEQYIITSETLVAVSEQKISDIKKKQGLEKDAKLEVCYSVVVSNDVVISANVFNLAKDNGFAILQPDKVIANRLGIAVGSIDGIKEKQDVFSFGYNKKQDQINLYSSHIDKKEEKIGETKYITFEGELSKEEFGGPLLDEEGSLAGLNVDISGAEGKSYILPVNVLRSAFDTLGITYISADSKYETLQEEIEKTAKKAKNEKKYTNKTIQVLKQALEEAEEVLESESTTNKEYEEQIKALQEAEKQLKSKRAIYKTISVVLIIIIAIIGSIILVILFWGRKKNEKLQYLTDKQSCEKVKQNRSGREEKNHGENIERDFDQTVAISPKFSTAFLVHQVNGERTLITKDYFVIGSQRDKVDFCIRTNRFVSRRHAVILNENNIFFIQDNNSMNHTFVNEKQLKPKEKVVLRNHDKIKFANEEFYFEIKM